MRSPDETASAWQKRPAHSFGVASGPVDVVCEALCFVGIRVWPPGNQYGQLEKKNCILLNKNCRLRAVLIALVVANGSLH